MPCLMCEYGEVKHDDPRDPPLDTEPCLCNDCAYAAYDEAEQELQDALDNLKEERRQKGLV